MSLEAHLDLQQALFNAVKSAPNLHSLLGNPVRFFDQRPKGASYPYLMLQRAQGRPVDADSACEEIILSLLCVSRFDGSEEVKSIIAEVRALLEGTPLTLSAHSLVNLRISYVDVFKAADRFTIYGLMRLRAVVETI